jgi:hypothetical protein
MWQSCWDPKQVPAEHKTTALLSQQSASFGPQDKQFRYELHNDTESMDL